MTQNPTFKMAEYFGKSGHAVTGFKMPNISKNSTVYSDKETRTFAFKMPNIFKISTVYSDKETRTFKFDLNEKTRISSFPF